MLKIFAEFFLFAFLGVAHEILWTGFMKYVDISVRSFGNDKRRFILRGECSLYMFPIYGSFSFIISLVQWLFFDYPWMIRGLIYMFLIYILEYSSGWLIKRMVGFAPWNYDNKYNISGLICLNYAPIWLIEGLVAEALYMNNFFLCK
jgi:uncharacterized membrane protein